MPENLVVLSSLAPFESTPVPASVVATKVPYVPDVQRLTSVTV